MSSIPANEKFAMSDGRKGIEAAVKEAHGGLAWRRVKYAANREARRVRNAGTRGTHQNESGEAEREPCHRKKLNINIGVEKAWRTACGINGGGGIWREQNRKAAKTIREKRG